jgi:murein DD-endopeptidase MepM/ murein hydrolase activator NlpD
MVVRQGGTLRLVRSGAGSTISVEPDKGAYWSLRGAGLDARVALEAAALIERRAGTDGAEHVTAVVGERPDRFGRKATPQLLYLAATRDGRPLPQDVALARCGRWLDRPGQAMRVNGLMQPVEARISSGFGERFHPILHFFGRMRASTSPPAGASRCAPPPGA